MLSLGCGHFGRVESPIELEAMAEGAIEKGIRFIDTAFAYQEGASETKIGKYLVPKYRDELFIMSKTNARTREKAKMQLDTSRKRLGIDVIDLYQIHTIETPSDADKRIDNGVLDVLLEAREKGIIRYIGFTGHKRTITHLRMLERLKGLGIDLDTCQLPVNLCDPHYDSFTTNVLPKLLEKDYGIIAMKTLANGQFFGRIDGWAKKGRSVPDELIPALVTLEQALHYVWSHPISTLTSGMLSAKELNENVGYAKSFHQLSEKQMDDMLALSEAVAGPVMEFYKVLPP
jgi:predicted aldo/keto reductase-like oxidoreductase